MTARWIEVFTGPLDQKKRYRQSMARLDALPEPYLAAAKASYRYLLNNSGLTDGETLVSMVEDFVELWEAAAADGTPVRAIVGDDPAEFVDSFAQAYSGKRWSDKQRERLSRAIDDATEEER